MIEHLRISQFAGRTYRLATAGPSNEATLAEMGISNMQSMLAILRASRADDPMRLLNGPFEAKINYKVKASRFSDGSQPVYYSALERDTARAEMRHHKRLQLLGVSSIPGASVFLREVACTFTGRTKDLRAEVDSIPELIGEEADGAYRTCARIAEEARVEGLDALLAPSARKVEGSCLPVFTRRSLSDPALGPWVVFTHDASVGDVTCTEVLP